MNRWGMTLLAAAGFLLIVRGGPDVRAATNKAVMVNANRVSVYPATGQDLVLTGVVVKVAAATNAASPVTLTQLQAATNGMLTAETDPLSLPLAGGTMAGNIDMDETYAIGAATLVQSLTNVVHDIRFCEGNFNSDGNAPQLFLSADTDYLGYGLVGVMGYNMHGWMLNTNGVYIGDLDDINTMWIHGRTIDFQRMNLTNAANFHFLDGGGNVISAIGENGIHIGTESFVVNSNGTLAADWDGGGNTISNATFSGTHTGDGTALTITELDPKWAAVSNAVRTQSAAAYGWGDHATNNYVADAPSNGMAYARQDGSWTVLAGCGDMLKATYDDDTNGIADTSDALIALTNAPPWLPVAGGTMGGAIGMGTNDITYARRIGTYCDPVDRQFLIDGFTMTPSIASVGSYPYWMLYASGYGTAGMTWANGHGRMWSQEMQYPADGPGEYSDLWNAYFYDGATWTEVWRWQTNLVWNLLNHTISNAVLYADSLTLGTGTATNIVAAGAVSDSNAVHLATTKYVEQAIRARGGAGAVTHPISDVAYAASWNGDTTNAPTRNAVYDQIESDADRLAFRAYANVAQTMTNGVERKIWMASEDFDNGSCFVTGTGATQSRFTPTKAGNYLVGIQLVCASVADQHQVVARVYKNGSAITSSMIRQSMPSTDNCAVASKTVTYLNGSTDYIEFYGTARGASYSALTNSIYTYAYGVMVDR